MKRKLILLGSILFLTIYAYPQIKVRSNGYIGMGTTADPDYPLHVKAAQVRFYDPTYTTRTLDFVVSTSDPQIRANNKIVFRNPGDGDWIDLECKNIITHSDSSSKKNVQNIPNGLEVVSQLRGVTFSWKNDPEGKWNAGLIAQEVERVIPEVVYTVDSTNEKLLSYLEIIPYIIEGVKELNQKFEEQKKTIDELSKSSLKKSQTINSDEIISNEVPVLYQNAPNPFNFETTIAYSTGTNCSTASINIYNLNGYQLISYSNIPNGMGKIVISGNRLKSGIYIYNLIVDAKEIDAKRMILTE